MIKTHYLSEIQQIHPRRIKKMNLMNLTNADAETKENKKVSTSTEESISNSPKDSFSVLAERLDTLQNFFRRVI